MIAPTSLMDMRLGGPVPIERGGQGPGLEHRGDELVAPRRCPRRGRWRRTWRADPDPSRPRPAGPVRPRRPRPGTRRCTTTAGAGPRLPRRSRQHRRCRRRRRRRRGVGHRHRGQRADPSGWRPATTHATIAPQSWPTRSKRLHPMVGHGQDVGHELVDAVVLDRRRSGAGRVAPLVEGEAAVARPRRAPRAGGATRTTSGGSRARRARRGRRPAPSPRASNVSPLAVTSSSCTDIPVEGAHSRSTDQRRASVAPQPGAHVGRASSRSVSSGTAPAMARCWR